MPDPVPGDTGEVVGAPRPWRNGGRPVGACGTLTLPCYGLVLPDHLFATWALGANTYIWQLDLINNGEYFGQFTTNTPAFPTGSASVTCVLAGTPQRPFIRFETDLVRGIDQIAFPDDHLVDSALPPVTPFDYSMPTPNAAAALLLPADAPQSCQFTEEAPI